MMRFKAVTLAISAAALAATPAIAAPVSASKLSVAKALKVPASARAAAKRGKSKAEGSTGIIIGVVAAVAIVGGIIVISDDSQS